MVIKIIDADGIFVLSGDPAPAVSPPPGAPRPPAALGVPRPLPTSSPRHTPRGAERRRARDTAGAVSRAGPRVIAAGTMIKAVQPEVLDSDKRFQMTSIFCAAQRNHGPSDQGAAPLERFSFLELRNTRNTRKVAGSSRASTLSRFSRVS
jgi:hypothetical protein